ncbi:component of RuvABC resolvasome, endonuclease [Pseudodesulfovibrio profundus]|uniref:Crossover junction endodeoxyribonuclease RuvC n=1 Tax=Pseudodesulfovibrio profundus TaxID=57320 RepID=A0A2C8F6C7_9BACT|nr:crossover junction endodeoxyribonuclease RuvC [Pseudodesulfovibrio profundus]SOB58149.1 component of RuvABC resolvasome, endonuclease [Pseudodesulfovibrio profundus]
MSGNGLIVIGLDPGSRVTGYGIVREISGQAELIETGTIRTPVKKDMGTRLGVIFDKLDELIKLHGPVEAAIENVFVSKNPSSALKLGQARGAAMAACATNGLTVSEYEPSKVKKNIVGVGNAPKDQVAFMVAHCLSVKKPKWAEDASDALAVAICHLNERRMRKLTCTQR